MTGTGGAVVSADDICRAVQAVLVDRMPALVELLELDTTRYLPISEWQQVPTIEALSTASTPAAAITSAGLTGAPTRDGQGRWKATWRVVAGFYERGTSHDDTQGLVRDRCALARTILLANPTLGGTVPGCQGLAWVGEEYARIPQRDKARTLGAGAVGVDVTVLDVALVPPGSQNPVVLSTNPTLTVRPAGTIGNQE